MKTTLLIPITAAFAATAAFAQQNDPSSPPPPGAPPPLGPAPAPPPSLAPSPARTYPSHSHDPALGAHPHYVPPPRSGGPEAHRPLGRHGLERSSPYGSPGQPHNPRRPGWDGDRPSGKPQLKPTPYLGVSTAGVDAALAAQLSLAEGFGLVVTHVVADGPAAAAGVQRFDILKSLDDQQLVSAEQLATLVRSRGKDSQVTLTVLRKGQEQKLTVKVGERMLPDQHTAPHAKMPLLDRLPVVRQLLRPAPADVHQAQETVRRAQEQMHRHVQQFQEKMKAFQNRLQEWQKNPGSGPAPEPPKLDPPPPPPQPPHPPKPHDILREAVPGGAPQVSVTNDGSTTTWNTAHARIAIKDDTGSLEIVSDDGKRLLTARDKGGKVIFDGPIDTEEQRRSLPESVRNLLNKTDIRTSADGGASATATAPVDSDALESEPSAEEDERSIQ